jgi:hypothetical protein
MTNLESLKYEVKIHRLEANNMFGNKMLHNLVHILWLLLPKY